MKTMLLLMLGRSVNGIFSDYLRLTNASPDLVVIAHRPDDELIGGIVGPKALASPIDNAIKGAIEALNNGVEVTVICNGGTTAQQVPIIKALVTHNVTHTNKGVLRFIEVTKDEIITF